MLTCSHSYQEAPLREGVAAMYLPLIGQVVNKLEALSAQGPGSSDRKELLACLLYVLQNSPQRLSRGLWRHLMSDKEMLGDPVADKMVSTYISYVGR